MRLIREPRCHIAAVGHALILFDLLRGVLPEEWIRKLRQEVAEEIAVGGGVGVDVFRSHSAHQTHGQTCFHSLDSRGKNHSIVADVATSRTSFNIHWIRIIAVAIGRFPADATGVFILPHLRFIACDDFIVIDDFLDVLMTRDIEFFEQNAQHFTNRHIRIIIDSIFDGTILRIQNEVFPTVFMPINRKDDMLVCADTTVPDAIFDGKTSAFTDGIFSGGNRIFQPFLARVGRFLR